MKKLMIMMTGLLLAFTAGAQDTSPKQRTDSVQKYCAKMSDGILTINADQKPVTLDVLLSNGTLIKTDGTVIRKDGTKTNLQDGDCVDKDGNLVQSVGSKIREPKQPER